MDLANMGTGSDDYGNAPVLTQSQTNIGLHPTSSKILPFIFLLFLGSGCAALIYEIVWFQLLEFVIGSSAVSLGVLLGTFMGGMCLGALVLPRVVSSRVHPLRVYVILELGIGLAGLAILRFMPMIEGIYVVHAESGMIGFLVRGVVCAACLFPPTMLMGATLPAVARWVESTPRGMAWMGLFYGGNTVGAVAGCLLAGFLLLPKYDMAIATYTAFGINLAVAALGLTISLFARTVKGRPQNTFFEPQERGAWAVYSAIALSGMSALGAEVVWTRLMSLLLGPTVYTFSVILAVFLLGLGVGSATGAMAAALMDRPGRALALCQLLLVGTILWGAYSVDVFLPVWPVQTDAVGSFMGRAQLDLARCMWMVLPAAILWGASFSLALAAVAGGGRDSGKVVAGIYAVNTLGTIFGALGFSMIFIPRLGTQDSQRLLVILVGAAALILFLQSIVSSARPMEGSRAGSLHIDPVDSLFILIAISSVTACAFYVPYTHQSLVTNGHLMTESSGDVLYLGEGMTSSVAVTKNTAGVLAFHVSGKVEASTDPVDMRLQSMLGHIPALLHPAPKSVLIVGCGAGVTAGCFVLYPGIQRIVICDIEPLVPEHVADFFNVQNHDVIHDPRVTIVYDDARHYVATTRENFDIITSDPIHPWVKGSATLYTREYFEMCRQHLNPGGLVTQWAPLYQSNTDVIKCEFATFFQAFPSGTIWGNFANGSATEMVLLGSKDSNEVIDVDALQNRLDKPDLAAVAASMKSVGFPDAVTLLQSYCGQDPDLQPWLADAQINLDINVRLQYLAGLTMNSQASQQIFDQFAQYRKYPSNLFTGSPAKLEMLQKAIEGK